MRKRYSRSYTVLSFLTMFSYRELPLWMSFFAACLFYGAFTVLVVTVFQSEVPFTVAVNVTTA